MRSFMRCIAGLVIILALSAVPAETAPVADDYIKGYAAAVLAREFKVRAPSLLVTGGIVQLAEGDLASVDESAVVATLTAIEGVTRVMILRTPASAGAAPTRPPDASATPDAVSARLLDTGTLPGGLLFKPLLADPRWPHFSLGYRHYVHGDDLDAVVAGTIGESLPFYRWTWPADQQWEVGGFALVTPIFDRSSADDLITEDYLIGLFLGWRRGALSALARVHHTSSHLGDEFALRGTIERLNLSYETLDGRLSWDVAPEVRLYGGAGYLFRRDPRSLDPWWLQVGIEFRSRWRAWEMLRPVAAADVQSHQQNSWEPGLSLRAGAQFESVSLLERNAQLLFEYYTGNSREGQFFNRDVEYFGFGVHFSF